MTQVVITIPNCDLDYFNALVEEHDMSLNCISMSVYDQRYEVQVTDANVALMIKLRWGGK